MKKKTNPYEAERQAHDTSIDIKISTKAPSKWRICDIETNEVFEWSEKENRLIPSYLPVVFPNFGDKSDIINKAKEFTVKVEKFFDEYGRALENKKIDTAQGIIELGMKISKSQHELWDELIMWKLELDSWYKRQLTEKMMQERAEKEGKDIKYGGWHFCCGKIVNNGKPCPECGRE
jgi:hypothetical protein